MNVMSKFLSIKVQYLTSSLYRSLLLWTAKLAFPLKNNPKQHNKSDQQLQVGLKTLVHSSEEKSPPRILHCDTVATTSKPSYSPPPPSSSLWLASSYLFPSTMMGDVIGTESGDCMISDSEVEEQVEPETPLIQRKIKRARERSAKTRQFPPPITLLTHTGRMPWTFKREYGDDGRVVIRAVRMMRPEYVEAHRENGRLTMKLVPEDDENVCCEECGHPISEEEEWVVEIEELEFNEEPEGLESVDVEEEEEGDFDLEGELANGGSDLLQKCSMEKEAVLCGDLLQGVAYGGGLVQDSDSLWKGNGIGDASGYMGRPGSAPIRPMMTPVM